MVTEKEVTDLLFPVIIIIRSSCSLPTVSQEARAWSARISCFHALKGDQNFKSVNEILKCVRSNESC